MHHNTTNHHAYTWPATPTHPPATMSRNGVAAHKHKHTAQTVPSSPIILAPLALSVPPAKPWVARPPFESVAAPSTRSTTAITFATATACAGDSPSFAVATSCAGDSPSYATASAHARASPSSSATDGSYPVAARQRPGPICALTARIAPGRACSSVG